MPKVSVEIKNLKELTTVLKRYPDISAPRFAKAINAALATVQKNAIDQDGGVFQFKTPRALRTGFLSQSFGLGIKLANSGNLRGEIGPTAHYAIYVHEGSRGRSPNPFMVRIVKKAEKEINNHFADTLANITNLIAKGT